MQRAWHGLTEYAGDWRNLLTLSPPWCIIAPMSFDQHQEEILFPTIEDADFEDGWERADDIEFDDDMNGDHASALASAGWGTDEDYGFYGDDGDCFGDEF